MNASNSEPKRYNIIIPAEIAQTLEEIADSRDMKVVELIRSFIRLGLLAVQLQEAPDAALIIREGNRERQVFLI